ncbi:hypothetical protein Bpfe_011116, partial [Biomphalaria pfeifferi]
EPSEVDFSEDQAEFESKHEPSFSDHSAFVTSYRPVLRLPGFDEGQVHAASL